MPTLPQWLFGFFVAESVWFDHYTHVCSIPLHGFWQTLNRVFNGFLLATFPKESQFCVEFSCQQIFHLSSQSLQLLFWLPLCLMLDKDGLQRPSLTLTGPKSQST
ncbi:hypothetical protein ATANTOWER_032892 [Ataeniobius toweri]|uniref:Secreted protein n=1 Tax=Ataeniobius toweri TaxID=208326 RepID=A0ABU7AAA2_9TELE|nr:hypothetical protein [Ataeniobius toweri]